jgi:hypothetical protein
MLEARGILGTCWQRGTCMQRVIITSIIVFGTLMLIFKGLACNKSENMSADAQKTGGECSYDSYPGIATITRIGKTDASRTQATMKGGPGYEGYEIWFLFKTDQEIKKVWARKGIEKERLFLLANSWYPGQRYIEKYHIAPGKNYPCTLQVISKGTCTPIIFKFAEPVMNDYFEAQQ